MQFSHKPPYASEWDQRLAERGSSRATLDCTSIVRHIVVRNALQIEPMWLNLVIVVHLVGVRSFCVVCVSCEVWNAKILEAAFFFVVLELIV